MRRAQQLGRYHLLDRIAFGGMAEIYRAKTFDSSGQAHWVAIKRVLAHLAEDDDFIQMLVDEAKIASQVKHPNIARVYEFTQHHGEYFIAMEHVDGKDLRTILERCRQQKKSMPPQHAAFIAAEVATALHSAHNAVDADGKPLCIVHRDVSPSNVLCAYTGEVKLCDFGIAKANSSRVQTKTGVIKGKVKYMSPEQALGRKLDHRSDIFSLGVCLYEMLTRLPPFTAVNEMDLLIKVRDAKYRPVRSVVPEVPQELEAICDRCLSRSRAHRYQSAGEVATALHEFLDRYRPGHSRSHLGRYVRLMFAAEIERELRQLEEYVLSDQVNDDMGENLIAQALGPEPEYEQFSPHPSQVGDTQNPAALLEGSRASGPGGGRQHLDEDGWGAQISTVPSPEPEDDEVGGFDIHDAETLIIDTKRSASQGPAPSRPAESQPKARPEPPQPGPQRRPQYDEALHNAPTMIFRHTPSGPKKTKP